VEGTRSKEEVERVEGEASKQGKDPEINHKASKRNLDED